MREWVTAAAAGGQAGVYRARALLVLAVYDECWLSGRPCAVLAAWAEAPELHAPLLVEPREALLLRYLAAGPVSNGGERAHGGVGRGAPCTSAARNAPPAGARRLRAAARQRQDRRYSV